MYLNVATNDLYQKRNIFSLRSIGINTIVLVTASE